MYNLILRQEFLTKIEEKKLGKVQPICNISCFVKLLLSDYFILHASSDSDFDLRAMHMTYNITAFTLPSLK